MADSVYTQYHHSSLLSANPSQQPPPFPPPPPPPIAQHQSRKAVFARFAQPFIGASRPPSSSGNGPTSNGGLSGAHSSGHTTAMPTSAPNPSNPRNAKYNLNSAILALSASSDGDKVVVAGREILRILHVGYNDVSELANLRLPGEQKKHFQGDVKWGPLHQKNVIATAGTNGTISLYDTKEGKLDRTLREHARQVHRLVFNQANGNLLLSASQDGTIKLWDLREKRSRHTFVGKADAARDVQFNAAKATEFAAAFDNGTIQRWDYRKESIYERKINAHNGPAFSVDWHPDGKHCASGGRDRAVKVWDFYADPRRKPKHTIATMASISRICWRPLKNSSFETTQLATCAIGNDHRVQIWDLKRLYVPTRILDVHDSITTGILWKDEDILWSCSKDCTFVQNDVQFAYHPINSLSHNAFSWGPNGEFTFASQRKGRNRDPGEGGMSRVTFDLDDDMAFRDDRRGHHGRSSSFKSFKSTLNPVHVLDGQLETFVLSQTAARVTIPSLFDNEAFEFLANDYIIDLEGIAGGKKWKLSEALEINARLAWKAQKYRTAKSWKMIQLAIASEDALAERLTTKEPESVVSVHPAGLVARRALGLGGEHSASQSGGATPRAGPLVSSPLSMPNPTVGRTETADDHLLLPPPAFRRSPSSSMFSTDGDDSTMDHYREISDSDSPESNQQRVRPNLSVDTQRSPKSTPIQGISRELKNINSTTVVHSPTQNGKGELARKRPSIDEDLHNLRLFTSSTERSDPFNGPSGPNQRTDSTTHINSNHQFLTSKQSAEIPRSRSINTLPDSSSTDSTNLNRQFSLVSEQTSSSYGLLSSTRSDLSNSDPATNSVDASGLPPISEELHASTTQRPHLLPELHIPNSGSYYLHDRTTAPHLSEELSSRPWSVQNLANALLTHSLGAGDCQTAATLLLLLLHKPARISFHEPQVTEVLASYVALLTQHRMFTTAALVRKLAPQDDDVRQSGMWSVDVDLSCGECGRAVGGRGGGWCGDGGVGCVICGEVGRGRRWTVCAVCGHGGCEACMRGWFLGDSQDDDGGEGMCPAVGCACECLPR